MSLTNRLRITLIASVVLLAGCAHGRGSASNPERVCTSSGRTGCRHYDYRYSEDAATLEEKTHESLERHMAESEGRPYSPTKYAAETPAQFAERSHEESDRRSAAAKGEPYLTPMRKGESADHWATRAQDSYKSPSSGFGSSSGLGTSSGFGRGGR